MIGAEQSMFVTCPGCGSRFAASERDSIVECDCGCRFAPGECPTVADPFLGRELPGEYRIESVLATGGAGTVYRASQRGLDRSVAVMVLSAEVSGDPPSGSRFEREAYVVAALNHPHSVQVLDRGQVEGRHFLVMELVEVPRPRESAKARRNKAIEADGIMATLWSVLAGAAFVVWAVVGVNDPRSLDDAECLVPLTLATAFGALAGLYGYLAAELRRGRRTRLNVGVWSWTALLTPVATSRARMLLRDESQLPRNPVLNILAATGVIFVFVAVFAFYAFVF